MVTPHFKLLLLVAENYDFTVGLPISAKLSLKVNEKIFWFSSCFPKTSLMCSKILVLHLIISVRLCRGS